MGNNLIKDHCVYELTDETPDTSDLEDSNDCYIDFLDKKKKKTNPQWALDITYIKQKIIEQNNLKLYQQVFGKREKTLKSIGKLFKTDKYSHGYLPFYDKFFTSIRKA